MATDGLLDTWTPTALAAALDLLAADSHIAGEVVFDFGAAGTVTVKLDLDPTKLTPDTLTQLLGQLAELSLLAARSTT